MTTQYSKNITKYVDLYEFCNMNLIFDFETTNFDTSLKYSNVMRLIEIGVSK